MNPRPPSLGSVPKLYFIRRLAMIVLGTLTVLGAITVSAGGALAATPLPATPLPAPGLPVLTQVTATSIGFTWSASTGPVLNYTVQVVDVPQGPWHDRATTAATTYTDAGLNPESVYIYRVVANPTPGSGYTTSLPSPSLYQATAPLVDNIAPTKPASVAISLIGPTYATVASGFSTDNFQVAGYVVQRQVSGVWTDWASSSTLSVRLQQLAPSTSYTVATLAFDPSGNRSPRSDPVTFTTRSLQAGPVCRAQLQGVSPTSFILFVFVDNLTVNVLSNWNVTFTMPAATTVNGFFNDTVTRTGDTTRLTAASNVNPVNVGASVYLGIFTSRPVNTPLPSGFTINGAVTGPVSCTVTQL